MIEWKPFTDKHKYYIHNTVNNVANVAEGAVRAGKTIDNCIAFALNLEYTKDKIHLASGSTLANAKLNIGDCNGFGLEYLFQGRCRWGKYKENEALFVNTKSGEKVIIFTGGGKADSYKKILGNSYGMWIATEINEHYDSEDSKTSFIKVAFARMLAADKRKWFWDLNPGNPNHTIYTDYLDKWQRDGLLGGYNYEHFTIFDNASITEQRKEEIISQYDKNSIWYKRDILGERVVAEGLIYRCFNDSMIIPIEQWNDRDNYGYYKNNMRNSLIQITMGIDFGGNKSATAFNLTGITRGFANVVTLMDKRIARQINPDELEKEFVEFVKSAKEMYPNFMQVYCDTAETTLINGLKMAVVKNGLKVQINGAEKRSINKRIQFYDRMMAQGRYFITSICNATIDAWRTAIYDPKKIDDERLDDGTSNIDNLDAQEYSTERIMDTMMKVS